MMTNSITRPQAEALAHLLHTLRADWDIPGIIRALSTAKDRGTAYDIAVAALHAANTPTNRTPAVIQLAGEHWTRGKPLGTTGSPIPGTHEPRCATHPWDRATNCRACASERLERTTHDTEAAPQGLPRERIRQILATATKTSPRAAE